MGQVTGDPNKPAAAKVAAPVDDQIDDEPAPVASAPAAQSAEPAGEGASRAQDILAMIRNRQK
jgi:hypothetical protein